MKFVCDKVVGDHSGPILWSFENIGVDDWEHLKRGMVSAATFTEAVDKVKGLIGSVYPERRHNYNKHIFDFKAEGMDLVKYRGYPFLLVDWNQR